MSVSRPARCLLSGPSIPKLRPRSRCQNFHSSPTVCERRRPKHTNIKAIEMGLINSRKPAKELFKPYTKEERAALAKRYTPAQIAAIEAGETAIDPEDLKSRGVMRSDPGMLPYFDDLSRTRNVLDRPQKYQGPVDPNPKLMYLHEMEREVQRASKELEKKAPPAPPLEPGQEHDDVERQKHMFPTRLDLMKIFDDSSLMMGSNGKAIPVHKNPSLLAPALPKKFLGDEDEAVKTEDSKEEEADPRDPDGLYNRLMKQTGLTLDEIFEYKIKILVNHSVTNQTRLGKIRSMYILAVAGNGDGRLGIGEAKGQEVEETMSNAKIAAIRAMQPIPRYEDRTIYGDVEGKVSAVKVQLMARPPGFGLRCQHLIFEMARAAGIQDLAARVPNARNKMNTVKAAYQALMKQRIPDEIARARGKKLVDVRKVYYGGRV